MFKNQLSLTVAGDGKKSSRCRRAINARLGRAAPIAEQLESRTFLSESASAQLSLVSTGGTQTSPVYNYDITLKDTGTTNLGTFWFGWIPGEDFLPSTPVSEGSPTGWGSLVTGSGNSFDGAAVQWIAKSPAAAVTPGESLSGFVFSSPDSPAQLAGTSPSHAPTPALTSFVYIAAPLSDPGFMFTVTSIPSSLSDSTTTLATSASAVNGGDSVTFTATVAPAMPGGAMPTGTVSFFDNGAAIGTASAISAGIATLTTSSLPVGSDSITATYNGDITYATSTSTAVSETVSPPAVAPIFVPTIVRSTLPATAVVGVPAHGVVLLDVTNQSGALSNGLVTLSIYATTDGAIDGSAVLLTTSRHRLIVRAGKAAVVPLLVKSLPPGLTPGSYKLLARATDAAGASDDSTAGAALEVQAPFVSLSEAFTRLTLGATAIAGAKTRALAALKITNAGNVPSSGVTTIAFYLSNDGLVDDSSTLIKSFTRPLRILPGKAVVLAFPLVVIPGVATNNYFVVAQVTDPKQQTSSVNSGSQVSITAP